MAAQRETLICTITSTIAVNMVKFKCQELTEDVLTDGKAQIKLLNGDLCVMLYEQPCGMFNKMTSKTLETILQLKLAKILK